MGFFHINNFCYVFESISIPFLQVPNDPSHVPSLHSNGTLLKSVKPAVHDIVTTVPDVTPLVDSSLFEGTANLGQSENTVFQ